MMLKVDLCATTNLRLVPCLQAVAFGTSYCTACKQAVAHVILLEVLRTRNAEVKFFVMRSEFLFLHQTSNSG